MSIESLQRAADAAGFATVSDENQSALGKILNAPRMAPAEQSAVEFAAAIVAPAAAWGRASFSQLMPSWAIKG